MNPLNTVASRLALALLVLVGGTLAIVYVTVVPFYSRSLLDTRLAELRRTLQLVETRPRSGGSEIFPSQAWIEDEAEPLTSPLGARVVVFSGAPLLLPVADSNGSTSRDVVNDPLVRRASASAQIVSGETTRDGASYAEAAVALGPGQPVLLLSLPVNGDLESVSVVRRRVLLAGLLATAFAIVLGYFLARLFVRRLRRLERAAERIAEGDFSGVLNDPAQDELGQLAQAFEQMRQRLATLERARGEFIANASHELRTPLFALGGFLELLGGEDDVDAETREEFLEAMRGQVSRLTLLASVLLDLSRIDAGRLAVEAGPVDLHEVAATLVSDFQPRAKGGDHELALTVRGHPQVLADEERVFQIGRILVENAILHTAPGVKIEVEVSESARRGVLAVTDHGAGIPADAQRFVFERFFRLGGGVASGSGLGLAIASELATLMGGTIELTSVPGRTTFTLTLPAAAADRSELEVGGRA